MDYRIRHKLSGIVYRVPEDIIPSVACAMVSGGSAERLEEKKVESSAFEKVKETATKVGAALRTPVTSKR